VAGSPLKAAIGGLLQIIQITDVGRSSHFKAYLLIAPQTKHRNNAALNDLSSRVRQLSDFLLQQPEPRMRSKKGFDKHQVVKSFLRE
jgi:hypothetical protein